MKLKILGNVSPVTALCVYDGYILAGCGSEVQMYSLTTCKLKTSFVALPCRTIHGFKIGPVSKEITLVCVFGAKCIRILKSEDRHSKSFGLESLTAVHEFDDWIWDAVWLQIGDRWTLGIALAHNTILHWDWQDGQVLQRATCSEKCILYCCHFIGKSWSDLVLAAGTVFNQVILWSPGNSNHGESGQSSPVLHRLSGHKGVIFSIFYHHGLRRICSASDDRSIMLHQVTFQKNRGEDVKAKDWEEATIEAFLTVFGHSGRVWDVVLFSELFVSVGEDAHCIVWSYEGKVLHKHKGHKGRSIWSLAAAQDETFVVTGGGDCSIRQWHLQTNTSSHQVLNRLTIPQSLKVVEDDFVRTLALWDFDTVVLVTNAGSVLCHSVSSGEWRSLAHDPDFSSYSTLAKTKDNTFLAIASITGHVKVLQKVKSTSDIRTTKCSLYSGKICGLTWVGDQHLLTTGLEGQCILALVQQTSSNTLTISVVAQLTLPVCKHRWVMSGCLIRGASLPLSSSSSASLPDEKDSASLICGDRNGSVHFFHLTESATDVQREKLPSQTFTKIHGAAGVTCVSYHSNTVFTAGRDGLYRRWTLQNNQLQLLNKSRVFKGFDWIDRLWFEDDSFYILGFYSSKFIVWDQKQGEQLLEAECGGGHRAWDCCRQGQGYRFVFIKAKDVVMVTAGQSSSQTIVKPFLHGLKVWEMRHLCSYEDSQGGLKHIMCSGSEDTTLSLGTLHSHSGEDCGVQWEGQHSLHGHLSSVRTVAVVHSQLHNTSPTQSTDDPPFNSDNQCSVDFKTFLPSGDQRASEERRTSSVVFSAGGRAQIQAWRVTVDERQSNPSRSFQDGLSDGNEKPFEGSLRCGNNKPKIPSAVTQPHEHPTSKADSQDGESYYLHPVDRSRDKPLAATYEHLGGCFLGESRHKRHHKPWKTRHLKLDPETRIMSLAAIAARQVHPSLHPSLYLLAAAGSDGVLRLFLFNEDRQHFTLLCQSSHHNGCILKVFIHLHPTSPQASSSTPSDSSVDSLPLLFSAATDGLIAVWNLQPIVQWLLLAAVHDTGFQSEHVFKKCSDQRTESLNREERRMSHNDDAHGENKEHSESISSQKMPSGGQNEYFSCHDSFHDENRDASLSPQLKKELSTQAADSTISAADDKDDDDYNDEENDEDDNYENSNDEGNKDNFAEGTESSTMRNQCLGDKPSVSLQRFLESIVASRQAKASKERNWQWTPDEEFKAHQSGVNSLHALSCPDGSLLLASGGDDNALTVYRLSLKSDRTSVKSENEECEQGPLLLQTVTVVCKTDAHAAQITGVWVLSDQHIVTASIDQRVNLWRLCQGDQLQLESCKFADTADLSSMEVWQHGDQIFVGVCGEGMSLLTISNLET